MLKTQLNCAPYVAPSDLKEIQHPVTAFAILMNLDALNINFMNFCSFEV